MKKVGRYDIISELGRGAMGIVYRASDPTIGRDVALKVLSLSSSPGEGTNSPQEMFMREVRAAGRLTHPSIVTIHDAFDDKETQTSCIVMELVPGVTLEKMIESGHPPSTEQAISLVRQVAEALDYAHRNRVIHRDLKPANILVTEDGHAKITDFGIAKVLAREGVARTVGIMGTPSYMSPEQVTGGEVDARTDIFSLGIIIFTLLAGERPFTGNTAAVMFKIVYEEPPAASSLNPKLTPAQDYVIGKCLAKERNRRYSSARELVADLDDLQRGRPPRTQGGVSAPAPAMPPPADRTLDMQFSALFQGVSTPPPARPAPPAPPLAPSAPAAVPPRPAAPPAFPPAASGGPSAPPRSGQTIAMPISGLLKEMAQSAPTPFPTPPASPPAPKPPAQPPMPPPVRPAASRSPQPLRGQTLPMPVPDLTEETPTVPSSLPAEPAPSVRHEPTLMEQTIPAAGPDVSAALHGADFFPETSVMAPPPQAAPPETAAEAPATVARKSQLVPIFISVGVVALLIGAMWGYRKIHRLRKAPSPPPQEAVQTPPTPPIGAPTAPETPTSPTFAVVEQPAAPAAAAPEGVKKPGVRKPKPAPHRPAPAPAPPPAPEPAVVPPSPAPVTPAPAPAPKVETPVASIARVVQVVCNSDLKEATYTFSSGGKVLLQQALKAKKKKGGFLGIKGAYEGSFSQTITVPAGATEVSIHVVSKDGGTDLVKTVQVPPAGGFVPTLALQVDSDEISPVWKSSSGTK